MLGRDVQAAEVDGVRRFVAVWLSNVYEII